ncbi:Uma2 family endonuclease [Streptomyces candidus]|uniref:Uma2 family endonuclease n=2 Tax=Streptomyces candidus TaxID=67283 RepID=A0A7X0HFN5_9ACTN|nr:Uma2 family endonuclease [Streptomyces candidus]
MAEHDQPLTARPWAYLLETWRGLDVPEGWRAEIDEGRIVLVPPPHPHHNAIADELQEFLYGAKPAATGIYQTLGILIAPLDKLYVPDLVVMPKRFVVDADPAVADPLDAAEALLVVEITSKGNAREDRTRKLWAYAHAPVPAYLLIDRFDEHGPTSTLFTEPQNGAYKHADRVPFGETVVLPEPFGGQLDTARFPH